MSEQPMDNRNSGMDAIDVRVVRALETKPEVTVPAKFAARVAAHVPVRRAATVTSARYGLLAIRIAVAVLVVALGVVATRSADRNAVGVAVEWILCAQLAALAMWRSGVWRRREPEV